MQQGSVIANVDWLAVSVRFHKTPTWENVQPGGYIIRLFSPTKVWHDRVVVFTEDGDKIATILSRPRSKQLFEEGAGLIEIANEWLYHGCGWQFILHTICQFVPFEIVGVSRVDVCADFCPNTMQQQVIMGLSSGDYYVTGKQNGSEFWNSTTRDSHLAEWTFNKRIPHCQSWGHKTSNVKWKLYYKTRELYTVEDKPYIRDQWEAGGLDSKNVWRLELSVHYPHMQLLADRPITYKIVNREWLSILRSFYQSRFVVRRNEGHRDKSNDTRIEFIPELAVAGTDVKTRLPINEKRRNGRISLLRKLIQSCGDDAVLLNDDCREGVMALVRQIVEKDCLEEYFASMTEMTVYDWIEDRRLDAANSLRGSTL